MKKYNFLFLALGVISSIPFIIGCQTNGALISDKNLAKMIHGTWQSQQLAVTDIRENWIFNEGGSLYVTKDSLGSIDTLYNCSYSVGGGLTKSYVTVSGFPATREIYNGKWTVINITNDVLVMVNGQTKNGRSAGSLEREFSKKQ